MGKFKRETALRPEDPLRLLPNPPYRSVISVQARYVNSPVVATKLVAAHVRTGYRYPALIPMNHDTKNANADKAGHNR